MSSEPTGPALPAWMVACGKGVYAIDTAFHRDAFDAAYLMVEGDRAAFIDTGTNFAVPRLLGALDVLGLARSQVQWVIPTHVHLDHGGGVGLLMQSLPEARALVHPRGLPHLIDPTRLYEGALAIYGQDEMDRSYGRLVPVDAARARESIDGETIYLGTRPLHVAFTPGHARHHHCVWDEASQGWFTGDTFGLSYREFDVDGRPWILPSCTPVQFEPDVLVRSIETLLARRPQRMYLTHFGPVDDVQRLGSDLMAMLARMVEIGRSLQAEPERHEALKRALRELYVGGALRHGVTMDREELAALLAIDVDLNAQGMGIWLDRRR